MIREVKLTVVFTTGYAGDGPEGKAGEVTMKLLANMLRKARIISGKETDGLFEVESMEAEVKKP